MVMPLNHLPPILTPEEVAEFLGRHPETVRNKLRTGEYPFGMKDGDTKNARWLIPTHRLEAWLNGER